MRDLFKTLKREFFSPGALAFDSDCAINASLKMYVKLNSRKKRGRATAAARSFFLSLPFCPTSL